MKATVTFVIPAYDGQPFFQRRRGSRLPRPLSASAALSSVVPKHICSRRTLSLSNLTIAI